MTDIHKVVFKIFCILFASRRTAEKYSSLTLKRCNNWTKKFDVTAFLSLRTKNCNIENYDVFLNTFEDNFIQTLPDHRFFSTFPCKCVIMY